ncbi:MAG: hypothetical protein QM731_01810 [Chitinophagaceae bacterium]
MSSDNKSPHILNTSANLLGFCLIIITSIKISKFGSATLIDDLTAVASVLLMASCMLSFLSMRYKNAKKADKYEYIADIVFMAALAFLTIIILMVSFNLMD